jgi:ribonuclease G
LPEWLVERGIGETRAALIEHGHIIEARIELDGATPAGTVLNATLVASGSNGRNGTARDQEGGEYLLPNVPREITQGAAIRIEVTRPALPGSEPWKRPLAKVTNDESRQPIPLAERLRSSRLPVRSLRLPAATDELGQAGWHDVTEEARSGHVDFPGVSLGLFVTPAMTLIDVDGMLPPAELMVRGAEAAARAIRRLDIGGSIGIDLPTVGSKAVRQEAAAAIDATLPQPFERTAVNGFGFLQIVRPRSRPSLLEIWSDRASAEARALLRRSAFEGAGAKRLVAHPTLIAVLEAKPKWLDTIARQIGGAVSLRAEPSLPIHGGYAEEV